MSDCLFLFESGARTARDGHRLPFVVFRARVEFRRCLYFPRQREFRIGCSDSDSSESPFPDWMTVGLGFAWYEVVSPSNDG